MIIRKIDQLKGTPQHVETPDFTSTRFFTKSDGLGFSFHETTIVANAEQHMWYKNHVEAVIITEGTGEIINCATGETTTLGPGSAYALTGDKHIFKTFTKVVCYCVFQPGLRGDEVHDSEGSYPLLED